MSAERQEALSNAPGDLSVVIQDEAVAQAIHDNGNDYVMGLLETGDPAQALQNLINHLYELWVEAGDNSFEAESIGRVITNNKPVLNSVPEWFFEHTDDNHKSEAEKCLARILNSKSPSDQLSYEIVRLRTFLTPFVVMGAAS